ncbi:hypothetical protein ARMSODRAFT_980419 [Armillaria solidipes]|uniref:Uncharacterized protein n=1 Tax=Armillaria solidipes TaxID=1076256 RepID=A0A2H3BDV4_9AGAR|nr:hypothetical protein ARMSODRAFT_980419 [Armillaria solidipes]
MPAELTDSKMKRRTRRKGTEDFYKFYSALAQEVKDKRSREECQGYVSLCPNGSLSMSQGSHFLLAATEHLHRKVVCLTGQMQVQFSDIPHPLLHDGFAESEGLPCTDVPLNVSEMASMTEVPDMYGTLAVSDHGISRIFGLPGGLKLCRPFYPLFMYITRKRGP